MPEKIIEFIESLVELKIYRGRNEAIRTALRNFVEKESNFLSNLNVTIEKIHYLHKKYIELDTRLRESIITTTHEKTRESIISTAKKFGLKQH